MVYIITSGKYSDYRICAVTLDKDKAEKLKKMYIAKGYDCVDIEEFEEDSTGNDFSSKELNTEPIKYYRVQICRDKNRKLLNNTQIFYRFEHKPSQGQFGVHGVKYDTDVYIAYIEAKDEKHAEKIAQDMYAQALAEYYGI